MNSNLLALVLVVAAVIVFLRLTQRSSRASSERIRSMRKQPEQMTMPAHNLDAPPQAAQWEVQMHELARDLTGQLDSKIVILQQLLRTADERIAQLNSALAAEGPPDAGNPSPPIPPVPPLADAHTQDIYRLADAGYPSDAIAARIGRPRGEIDLILSLRS